MEESQRLILAGETVELLPARALWWPGESTLFIADFHLGKAAAFRALSIPLPAGTTQANLDKLSTLLGKIRPQRLVVLGDLFHSREKFPPGLQSTLAAWRGEHFETQILLVRGNHDPRSSEFCDALGIASRKSPALLGPWRLDHEAVPEPGTYTLGGHQHPGLRVSGKGRQTIRLPAFIVGKERTILPAFGEMTGLSMARREKGDRAFAVGPQRVFEV